LRIRFSRRAERDLIGIGDWIRPDNPPCAESFVDELDAACVAIGEFPFAYPEYPGGRDGVRKRSFGNYLIFYRIRRDHVLIVSIRHAARRH
jgi:toxin ParE1/3/4